MLADEGHVTVLLKHGAGILEQALQCQPAEATGGAVAAAEGAEADSEGKLQVQADLQAADGAGQQLEAAGGAQAQPALPMMQKAQQVALRQESPPHS